MQVFTTQFTDAIMNTLKAVVATTTTITKQSAAIVERTCSASWKELKESVKDTRAAITLNNARATGKLPSVPDPLSTYEDDMGLSLPTLPPTERTWQPGELDN